MCYGEHKAGKGIESGEKGDIYSKTAGRSPADKVWDAVRDPAVQMFGEEASGRRNRQQEASACERVE